ncbi:MAG: hypothetical protein SO442_08095 [Prevotella sp.]|nr:hypothetical protein [Prevotella sp.]MDY6270908.1 hypothetical protein [Prevotella sp.]
MSKKIAVSLLLALTVTLTAQAQHKQSLMKRITEAAKETLNDMKQDTKPQAVHNQWDMYVIPHVGMAVSNITYSGDMHPGVRAGVDFEGVMLPRLSVTIGIDYLNQGAANVPYGGQKYDYSFGLIDTNLLAHWYPLHTKPLSVFAGVRATRVVSAKATLGSSHTDIKDQMHSQDLSFPVGVTYEWGQWQADLRYDIAFRRMAHSEKAKMVLGDYRNDALMLTVGYKIQLF